MRYFTTIVIILALTACASVKKNNTENPLFIKESLKNINLDGNISTTFPGLNQSLAFSLNAAAKDSLKLEIYGPMSFIVGKLFSTPKRFKFYNIIMSEAYRGTPSAKNLKYALNLPLEYNDFVSYLRCEPPKETETFQVDFGYNSNGNILYKSVQDGYVDFVLVEIETSKILRQQRKLVDGKVLLNVLYDDYEQVEDYFLPKSITFNFPEQDGSIFIKCKKISVNKHYEKPFNFTLPASVKINNFD